MKSMKNKRLKSRSLNIVTASLALAALHANADTLSFKGTLHSLVPKVSVTNSKTPTAFVEEVKLAVSKNGVHCDLTTNTTTFSNTYEAGKKPLCLFEWIGTQHGLVSNNLESEGVLTAVDKVNFDYQVSLMDAGQKIPIVSDTFTMDVNTPKKAVITSIESVLGGSKLSELKLENNNKRNGLERITVNIEERPYPQKVIIQDKSCVVEEGQSSCFIGFEDLVPGLSDAGLVGVENLPITSVDQFDYLEPEEAQVELGYDYRPPTLNELVLNANNSESVHYDLNGMSIEVEPNKGLAIIDTPHSQKEGDWWIPQINQITMKPLSTNSSIEDDIVINGVKVRVPIINGRYRSEYNIRQVGDVHVAGDKAAFIIDISSLPDGIYSADISVQDKYKNASDKLASNKRLDRMAPIIVGVFGISEIRENSTVDAIFLNDFYFAAKAGWDDGSEIKSVTINDTPMTFEMINDGIVRIQENSELESGKEYLLKVTAVDSQGNTATKEFKLNYMDVNFELFADRSEVYAQVQTNELSVVQRSGQRCAFTSSRESAIALSGGTYKGCVVEFKGMPSGLDIQSSRGRMKAVGTLNTVGSHEVGFDVVYYNSDGSRKRFEGGSTTVVAKDAPPVSLALLERNKVAEGVYSMPYNSRYTTDFSLTTATGDVLVNIASNGNTDVLNLRETSRAQVSERRLRVKRVDNNESGVWSEAIYDIDASYIRRPNEVARESFKAIITPSTRTNAYLNVEAAGSEITTSDEVVLTGNIGSYDRRSESYNYLKEQMGEWSAHLAVYENKEYIKISDEQDVDDNGEVVFKVAGGDLFEKGRRFHLVAKAKSKLPGFDMEIVSRPAAIEIIKAGELDGNIVTRQLEGRIPFSATLAFFYEDYEDMKASGGYVWQSSTDGVNWSDIDGMQDSSKLSVRITEPERTHYRVLMTNRVSGVTSSSDVIELTGYEVADIAIEGDRVAINGVEADYKAVISEDLIGSSDGVFEWSTDEGVTWTEGTSEFKHIASGNYTVMVRHRLNTAGEFDLDAYSQTYKRINVVNPEKLYVNVDKPRFMEVGIEGVISGGYRLFNNYIDVNVIEKLTLPDGTVLNASSVKYTPISSDIKDNQINFKYEAWVEGLREETYQYADVNVIAYDYNFDLPVLDVEQRYSIAPTPATATITMNVQNTSPDIEFNYQWELEEGFDSEIVNDRGQKAYLMMNESGQQAVKVNVEDNRGNKAELIRYVDVNAPKPAELELQTWFNKDQQSIPFGVYGRLKYSLEHPRDYVVAYEWYLDGKLVYEGTASSYFYEINEVGSREMKVVMKSKFGQVGEKTFTFDALPNIPPTCNPTMDDDGQNVTIYPNCKDSDGSIAAYYYQWGEEAEFKMTDKVIFRKSRHPNLSVKGRAVDNGGEEAEFTFSW